MSRPSPAAATSPEPTGPLLRRFDDVVALAGERREIGLKTALERDVRVVAFEEGRIELALAPGASTSVPHDLSRALNAWTGRRWIVSVSSAEGRPTIAEERQARDRDRRQDAAAHPLVQAVLASFPGAEIVDVRDRALPPEPLPDAEAVSPDEPERDDS